MLGKLRAWWGDQIREPKFVHGKTGPRERQAKHKYQDLQIKGSLLVLEVNLDKLMVPGGFHMRRESLVASFNS